MKKGERIKKLREQKGLTQIELANLLNTTKQTISKYEKSIVTNIPSDRIEKLAEILESTPEYILGWEQIQKNNDIMADIIVEMRTNAVFFEIVKNLYALDKEKRTGVGQMLAALVK